MKFGKELKAQIVPEWEAAYMNYDYLKNHLKEIQKIKARTKSPTASVPNLKRKLTLYRAFSGLRSRKDYYNPLDMEDQPILINPVMENGYERYQTTFLMVPDEGGELELVYFRRLDEEFNKVGKFYKSKVEEVVKEASMLNKQMDAWIAFRFKVENPVELTDWSVEISRIASDVAASASALLASTPSGAKARGRVRFMDVIEEDSRSSDPRKKAKDMTNTCPEQNVEMSKILNCDRPASLEILNHVRINKTSETPRSTIRSVLKVTPDTELKFTKENLKKVEEQLKRAFVEFYHKLRLLKIYSFMNVLAFSKIMKKYDKITSRNASKTYMEMVDGSYLGSSDEVTKLMERVEATFIKHFSNSNRSKGMRILRPEAKRRRHWTSFFSGFLFGCTIALIVAVALIIHLHKIVDKPGWTNYKRILFPLYSLFLFIVLHMLMFAANIYFWKRYRVNYAFIFGFKPGTELGYLEVLVLSFGIAVMALCSILLNINMELVTKTKDNANLTELVPLLLISLIVVLLVLPLNILYRPARYFFLVCLVHCIAAPLYKVTLPDFFLADQLTSQVQAIRSLQFYICYYGWGDYKQRTNTCTNYDIYNAFYFIVAVIPYWSRLLQCIRRWFEEKDPMQGYDGAKYFLAMVAVCLKTTYSLHKGDHWKVIVWVSSAIAAIVGIYWDVVVDWGLLQRHSKNRWLRNKLLIPHKQVYYLAMVLNVLLRLAWLQTVINFNFTMLHKESMITIVACLEIFRRGIWNFFRLENEHLNNVGKFRAFKSVPLPFNYDGDDDKHD